MLKFYIRLLEFIYSKYFDGVSSAYAKSFHNLPDNY